MPIDTRLPLLAGQGVTPVDPQAMQRGMANAYQLHGAQQQQQVRQLQLDEAQRQEFERQNLGAALRGTMTTDPVTGQQTPNMPGALSRAYQTSRDPLALLKVETEYGKSQAESRKSVLEAQKVKLEGLQKQTEFVSGIAQGALQAVQQGADPQVVWQRAVSQVAQAGLPTENLPPTYDAGLLQQYAMSTLKAGEALQAQQKVIDQQLREYELAETQKRTGLQREELDVKRADLGERRAERLQTRESQQQQRLGDRENQLRDEFNTLTKDYRTVSDAYGRIQSAKETGPGDISLIFSYMRLLDPGSTVREGEFATAQNAGGVPERIVAQYNRLVSGERLAPETRKQFLEQAQGLYDQATRDYQRTRTHYQDLAKRYGADPANVTAEFGSTAAPRPSPGGAASGAGAPVTAEEIGRLTQRSGLSAEEVIKKLQSQGYRIEGLE